MEPGLVAAVALGGYLVGSISFSRIVAGRFAPGVDLSTNVSTIGGETFVTGAVSATAVRERLGVRFGLITGFLDMAKAAIPTFLVATYLPGARYELIVAGALLVGHDYPIFYRFRGGRGETAIYGALLVIDPLGVLLMTLLGSAIGFVAGNLVVLRSAGLYLMIPWFWLARGDLAGTGYMVFAHCVYHFSLLGEFAYYRALARRTTNEEAAMVEFGSGRGLGRAMDRWSLPAIGRRIRGLRGRAGH